MKLWEKAVTNDLANSPPQDDKLGQAQDDFIQEKRNFGRATSVFYPMDVAFLTICPTDTLHTRATVYRNDLVDDKTTFRIDSMLPSEAF